jgi:phage gp45-like
MSNLRVTSLRGRTVGVSPTLPDGAVVTGVTTSTSFSGNVTGNISGGTVAGSTGTFTGDVDIADKIIHTGDTNTAIRFPAADTFTVETAGSERLRVDSSGNFGIGEASPGSYDAGGKKLVLTDTTNCGMTIRGGTTGQGAVYFADGTTGNEAYRGRIEYSHSTDSFGFGTAGTGSRMVIDSSGRMLLGTTSSPTAGNGQYSNIVIQGYPNTPAGAGHISLQRGQAAFGTNNQIGLINFGDNTGASYAGIECYSDGNSGANDFPGRLVFSTTTDGASAPTEKFRIDNYGRLFVGTTDVGASAAETLTLAASGNCGITIRGGATSYSSIYFSDATSGTGQYAGSIQYGHGDHSFRFGANSLEAMRIDSDRQLLVGRTTSTAQGGGSKVQTNSLSVEVASDVTGAYWNRTDSNAAWVAMRFYAQNSLSGYIQVNTSSVTYATSSDYRLKENVLDIADGITRVKQLAPKRFNFIVDTDTTVDGFLAHEAQAVVPEAVTGTKDEVNDDGDAVMQGIDQAKLVPLLTAALQEAIAKIETLETKVAALEAG